MLAGSRPSKNVGITTRSNSEPPAPLVCRRPWNVPPGPLLFRVSVFPNRSPNPQRPGLDFRAGSSIAAMSGEPANFSLKDAAYWRARRSYKSRPGPRPTLGELQREHPWAWLWCERYQHRAPFAFAAAVIRWGPDVSSDRLRERACCTGCGNRARPSSIRVGAAIASASCLSRKPARRYARSDGGGCSANSDAQKKCPGALGDAQPGLLGMMS